MICLKSQKEATSFLLKTKKSESPVGATIEKNLFDPELISTKMTIGLYFSFLASLLSM